MGKKKDWKTSFLQAWDKLGVLGTLISLVPPAILYREIIKWGDFMNAVLVWVVSYAVVLVIVVIYYHQKKPEKLVEAVNRETQEPRQFFTLLEHAECIVINANAETVAKYLLKKYLEIAQSLTIGNVTYFVDRCTFFEPKEHGTLQYAIVARGLKETAIHGIYMIGQAKATADPLIEEMEMFTITISQGGENTSRVTFDTNIRELYKSASKNLFQDLKEAFKIGRVRIY